MASSEDDSSVRLPEDFVDADEAQHSEEDSEDPESSSQSDFGEIDDDEFNLEDESDGEGPFSKEIEAGEAGQEAAEDEESREEIKQASASQDENTRPSEVENLTERSRGEASTSGQNADEGLAAAFNEILAHPGPANVKNKAPILLASKSLAKRQREETEATAAQKAAKKLRQEMKQRGHVGVLKKGEDPASDAHEKTLYRTATRGVVQLFNAVSKAQRSQKEALASGAKEKDAKISKTSFFDELKGKSAQKKPNKMSVGPQEESATFISASRKSLPASVPVKGWDVLNEGFASLQGSAALKMKDWDKAGEEIEALGEGLSGSEGEEVGEW